MAKASSSRKRLKPKDTKRRGKKKVSPLATDALDYLDYKDVDLLRRFLSDRAKIRPRRVSGNDTQQQRVVSRAIKNAREMGLLPYTSRVTTQRRGRSDRPDRGAPRDGGTEREDEDRTLADVVGDDFSGGDSTEAPVIAEAPEVIEAVDAAPAGEEAVVGGEV